MRACSLCTMPPAPCAKQLNPSGSQHAPTLHGAKTLRYPERSSVSVRAWPHYVDAASMPPEQLWCMGGSPLWPHWHNAPRWPGLPAGPWQGPALEPCLAGQRRTQPGSPSHHTASAHKGSTSCRGFSSCTSASNACPQQHLPSHGCCMRLRKMTERTFTSKLPCQGSGLAFSSNGQ